MAIQLNETETRILGCLIEKQVSTPEYYPMSLNSLTSACNQKTNRSPVVAYDEATVQAGLDSLRRQGLAALVQRTDSRTQKYGHAFTDRFDLDAKEVAVLCELMLRGPQTSGELRNRCERLCAFQDLKEVDETLQGLMDLPEPLVARLPRRPGQKEQRFCHLFSGLTETGPSAADEKVQPSPAPEVEALAAELKEVREELNALKTEFEKFRGQFT
ncbi:MAG: YceH family protein [Thermodesulfovibrionales bacterium]